MAVAVVVKKALMGPTNEQGVHPFFSSVRDVSTNFARDPSFSQLDELFMDGRRTQSTRKPRKAKVEKKPSRSKQLSITNSPGFHSNSRMQSGDITLEKPSPVHSGNEGLKSDTSSNDLDIDPNLDRRKRRRTLPQCPPLQSERTDGDGDCKNQLRVAACSDKYDENLQIIDKSRGTEKSTDLVQSSEKGIADEYDRATTPTEEQDIVPAETPTSEYDPSPIKNLKPPKKLLKLSSDGKLGSPKSRTIGAKKKAVGKKKSIVQKRVNITKILILKYGNDDESRTAMAQKIENIFSPQISKIETPQVKNEPSHTNSALCEQSKPTHPFFLGKLVHQADGEVPVGGGSSKILATNDSYLSSDQGVQPSKKKSTVSGANADAWARLGGLGTSQRNSNNSRALKYPGAMEPLWPPRGMMHCRGLYSYSVNDPPNADLPTQQRKLKSAEVQIPENESVLRPYNENVYLYQKEICFDVEAIKFPAQLRRPQRRIMTGLELQEAICKRIMSILPINKEPTDTIGPIKDEFDNLANSPQGKSPTHHALLHAFDRINTSFTAFDTFQCETQEWTHKYAPRCTADVLHQAREIVLLRNWLRNLTVSSVENGSKDPSRTREASLSLKRSSLKAKKKRKRQEELDGFIVSSDEESNEMDELTDPDNLTPLKEDGSLVKRSIIRAGETLGFSKLPGDSTRNTNAVVISGPHGCGKTAAVYAVAQELGFEVFEINSGTRRNGKDLLDKVGDMTRNHLVHQAQEADDFNKVMSEPDSSVEQEINAGKQSTMKAFLQPPKKKKGRSHPSKLQKSINQMPDATKGHHQQKQSLILLEEVDVLFEEDKPFWTTALTLISQSKRPIIMTCTDEARLPLDEMALHAIFRLTSPPIQIATDYLLLIAANEGHLLSRSSISSLYEAKHGDLRASITELNFWCQMAIGDTKGGLDWMPIPSSSDTYINSKGERQRVVSEDSYIEGMGLLGNANPSSDRTDSTLESLELLNVASRAWDIDIEAWQSLMDNRGAVHATGQMTKEKLMETLELHDKAADAMSAADIYPYLGLRQDNKILLDTTLPKLPENMSNNYIEGIHLLQADPLQDPIGMSISVPLALQACSWRLSSRGLYERPLRHLNEETVNRYIIQSLQHGPSGPPVTRNSISSAFEPLSGSPKGSSLQPRGPGITTFDGPLSMIVEDVAPYVRTIVSYDLRLEEQRLRLSNLLSEGGRNGKRQRTTRASRAALEGGSKAHTRRERWFHSHTNFTLVLRTGGKGWQEAAWEVLVSNMGGSNTSHNGSRRSSIGTTGSEA